LNDAVDTLRGGLILFPRKLTFDSYIAVFKNQEILSALWVTLTRTLIGVPLTIISVSMLAYGLSKKELVGRKYINLFLIFTMYFNGGLIPTYMVMKGLNLIDTFAVFIFPGLVNVFWMILVRTFMEGIPKELEEAETKESGDVQPEADTEQAKKLLAEWGFVSKNDVQKLYGEYRAAERILETTEGLEKKYDGSDGRPKANSQEILEYMQDTGIQDPETAYKVKYEKEIDQWRDKKLGEAKKPGLVTEKAATTGKEPEQRKLNRDSLGAAIAESLGG